MAQRNQKTPNSLALRMMKQMGFKPLEPYKNANEPWRSQCLRCKKISTPRFKHVRRGSKCRYCAGHFVDSDDAAEFMKKNFFEPLVNYPSSQKPWKSKCMKCGKVSSPRYSHVVQRGHCCRHCAPNARVSRDQAVKTFVKANFQVLGNYENSRSKVLLKCNTCNKESRKTYSDVKQGQECGHCAGKYPLDEKAARKFFLSQGFKPLENFRTVNLPWRSECLKCGKVVSPTYGNVRSGKKCPYCKGNKVDPKDAVALMKKYGYKPLDPYVKSDERWRCLHLACGNEVSPKYVTIQQGYGGCRFCATSGFQYPRPSYLYFVEHDGFNAFKVGIANSQQSVKRDRLRKLGHDGWSVIKIWNFPEGTLPSRIEARFFTILRIEMKVPQYLSEHQMRYGGFTETFDRDRISQKKIINLIQSIERELKDSS